MHHFLAIFGATCGIYLGRFYCPMSNVTTLTELSTCMVDLRWLLYYHSMTDSAFYFYNGLIMTFTFGVLRAIFLPYSFYSGGFRANSDADFSQDSDFAYYLGQFSICAYFVLVALNMLWFKKMVAGSVKYWNKGKNDVAKEETDDSTHSADKKTK